MEELVSRLKRDGVWTFPGRTMVTAFVLGLGLAAVGLTGCGNRGRAVKMEEPKATLRFDMVQKFTEGMAPVKVDDKWGFIDTTGKLIITPQFDTVAPFTEGMSAVSVGGRCGYVDKTGKFAIGPQFQGANEFSESLALVAVDSRPAYIDKTGRVVFRTQFDDAGPFREGLASVKTGDKYGNHQED